MEQLTPSVSVPRGLPPQTAPVHVRSPRAPRALLEELTGLALAAPCRLPVLTWLFAMPGVGKTLLLGQLCQRLQEAGRRVIWIGLRNAGTHAGAIRERLAEAGGEPPHFILIDNLDYCDAAVTGTLVDDLLALLGPDARLIVTSTRRLAFDEVELRIRDELLRRDDDAFMLDEAGIEEMLSPALVQRIGREGVARIAQLSMGWLVGARLLSLHLEESACPELILRGVQDMPATLTHWVERNLLDILGRDDIAFLHRLARFHSFTVDQVGWVFQSAEAQETVERLMLGIPGLFRPSGSPGRWQIYTPIRQHLIEVSEEISLEGRSSILLRLAQWCMSFGQWRDALAYATEIGELEMLEAVLTRGGETLVLHDGNTEGYIAGVEMLLRAGRVPPEGVWLLYLLCQTFRLRDVHRANWFGARPHEGLLLPSDRDLSPAGICRLFWENRSEELHEAIARWFEASAARSGVEVVWVRHIQAVALMSGYRFVEARAALAETLPLLDTLKSPHLAAMDSVIHVALLLYEGNFREAERRATLGRQHAAHLMGEQSALCDIFAAFSAKCAIEAGDEACARRHLPQALRALTRHESIGASAATIDVAIELWDGCSTETLEMLHRAVGSHTPRLSVSLSCYLIRRFLRDGNTAEAFRQARLIGLDAASASVILPTGPRGHDERNLIALTSIELLIAEDRWEAALILLRDRKEAARTTGRMNRLVQYELLELVHALKHGDTRLANRLLISAIGHAHCRQIWRPFLNAREAVIGLSRLSPIGIAWFTLSSEQQFFAQLAEKLGLTTRGGCVVPQEMAPEILTRTERRILALTGQGLSNPEIARLESVSEKTIKWHLRNVYRKLGVTNRTMALRFAREAGVLAS